MGNTGLLRREAEITLLQPQLRETRRQELRNSPFFKSQGKQDAKNSGIRPLFKSHLVKEGEDFLLPLKKAPLQDSGFWTL